MRARQEGVKSSGEITSSQTITTATVAGLLYGIILRAGTSASSVVITTGGSSGTIVAAISNAAVTNAGDATVVFMPSEPIECGSDIYCTIAGTSAKAYVFYQQLI